MLSVTDTGVKNEGGGISVVLLIFVWRRASL